jgi:hypothetical protein
MIAENYFAEYNLDDQGNARRAFMSKIVYVLTNAAMPNLVKIGVTTRNGVKRRIMELSRNTGVPLPFQCHYAGEVSGHAENVEKLIHKLFAKNRVSSGKEFFSIDPEQAVLALRLASAKDVTPQKDVTPEFETRPDAEEAKAIKVVERQGRSKIIFSKLGIPPGAHLTLSRDRSLKCKVIAGNQVEFNGKAMSLSAAAVLALRKLRYTTRAASGPHYWMFKNKTIGQIRREKEHK